MSQPIQTKSSGILRFPLVTVFIIAVAATYFLAEQSRTPSNIILYILLSPLIHASPLHIIGNLIGLGIAGSLVELWICPTSQGTRIKLYILAYGISVGLAGLRYLEGGQPFIGLSAIIYEFLAFAIYYQLQFSQKLQRSSRLARAAIVFLVLFTFAAIAYDVMANGLISAIDDQVVHFIGFALGLYAFAQYGTRRLFVERL